MMRLQGCQTVILLKEANAMSLLQIEPLIAAAVVVAACEQTTGRRTRISRYDAESENCSGSNHPAQPNVSSPSMLPH
jgi:hypothetical protein